MLKRAWLLGSGIWAALCLWSGANRGNGGGIEEKDVYLALAPLAIGGLLGLAIRFVITGAFVKSYRRP